MPKLDTMLQRTNRLIFVSIAVLCFAGWLFTQTLLTARQRKTIKIRASPSRRRLSQANR